MPLNLGGSGSFVPHIRWMASTSSWTMSVEGNQQPVMWQECIFDFANTKTGWGVFSEGMAPEWIWDELLGQRAVQPTDGREWKPGFHVHMFSPQQFGGDGLREFATTGVGATRGINVAYEAFEQQAAANPGMVPVVRFDGVRPLRIGKGNTNEPILAIARWAPRPPALDAALSAALSEVAQLVTQPTTTVVPVAPVTGQLAQPAASQPAPVGPAAVPVAPPPAVADPLAPAAAPAAPVLSTTPEF